MFFFLWIVKWWLEKKFYWCAWKKMSLTQAETSHMHSILMKDIAWIDSLWPGEKILFSYKISYPLWKKSQSSVKRKVWTSAWLILYLSSVEFLVSRYSQKYVFKKHQLFLKKNINKLWKSWNDNETLQLFFKLLRNCHTVKSWITKKNKLVIYF